VKGGEVKDLMIMKEFNQPESEIEISSYKIYYYRYIT